MKSNVRILMVLGFLLALLAPPADQVSGANAPPLDIVGQFGGTVRAVAVQGQYAYIGAGPRLLVLDVSNPAQPTLVGQTQVLPQLVRDVVVAGDYAYLVDTDALHVIHVADPAHPAQVGVYDAPGYARRLAVAGSYAYVAAGGAGGLRIVDVSDPAHPVEAGFYDTASSAWDVAVSGDYAYVADYNDGLRILDVADPANPVEVGFYDPEGRALTVAVAGAYAYLGDDDGLLHILDVTDPANPSLSGVFTGAGVCGEDLAVGGGYAYVGYHFGGYWLSIVDVSNPANAGEVSYLSLEGVEGVAVSGSTAYVAEYYGLRTVSVANPAQPVSVGAYERLPFGSQVALSGDYAFVTDEYRGLRVVDISDPASPAELACYDTPGNPTGVAVKGGYAYVADYATGLLVIDVSDPLHPSLAGSYNTPGWAYRVALAGGYAYVADMEGGLRILDVSDPAHPAEVGFYDPAHQVRNVTVAAGDAGHTYAYLADQADSPTEGYLRILDVSDPAHPGEVGAWSWWGKVDDVALVGEYAYLAGGDALHVLHVADPANPVWVAVVGSAESFKSVTIRGSLAYLAEETAGVRLLDVTNPASPASVNTYDTAMTAMDVAVAGDPSTSSGQVHVYVTDWEGGLVVLGPAALQVSPPALTFLAEVGGADPQPRTVSVASSGGPLAWTAAISPTASWLEATPLSGTTPAEVAVSAHVTGLGPGVYETNLVVTADEEVAGSPAAIPITLLVVEDVHGVYLPLVLRNYPSP